MLLKILYFIPMKNYESTNLKSIFRDYAMSLGNAYKNDLKENSRSLNI